MKLARILLIFTALIWGATFVASKVCLKYINPVELMGLRMIIALPTLLAIIAVKRIKFELGNQRKNLFFASLIIAAHLIIQITGIKYTTATNTAWIVAMTPLVVAVFALLFLKEKIRITTVFGIVLATMGILFLVSRGNLRTLSWLSSTGDWLVLISTHTWALYTIVTRNISRTLNPLVVTFVILAPSALIALGVMGFTSHWAQISALPTEVVISLALLGVVGTALAHWFWQDGVAKIGAARAGVFLYLEPIAATAIAVPYLHESFGLFTAIGGSLVLLGVWLAQINARN